MNDEKTIGTSIYDVTNYHPNFQKPKQSLDNVGDEVWNQIFGEFMDRTNMSEDQVWEQFYKFYQQNRFMR